MKADPLLLLTLVLLIALASLLAFLVYRAGQHGRKGRAAAKLKRSTAPTPDEYALPGVLGRGHQGGGGQ